jgi:hypothetical protein
MGQQAATNNEFIRRSSQDRWVRGEWPGPRRRRERRHESGATPSTATVSSITPGGTSAVHRIEAGDRLDGESILADYRRLDFGADLGGYIIKDRVWFFGAYDRSTSGEVSARGHRLRDDRRALQSTRPTTSTRPSSRGTSPPAIVERCADPSSPPSPGRTRTPNASSGRPRSSTAIRARGTRPARSRDRLRTAGDAARLIHRRDDRADTATATCHGVERRPHRGLTCANGSPDSVLATRSERCHRRPRLDRGQTDYNLSSRYRGDYTLYAASTRSRRASTTRLPTAT